MSNRSGYLHLCLRTSIVIDGLNCMLEQVLPPLRLSRHRILPSFRYHLTPIPPEIGAIPGKLGIWDLG